MLPLRQCTRLLSRQMKPKQTHSLLVTVVCGASVAGDRASGLLGSESITNESLSEAGSSGFSGRWCHSAL